MSNKPIALLDLDDNLFQTRTKCSEYDDTDLELVSIASNGNHSYLTPVQKVMVDWLLSSTEAIPVTARGTGAYARAKIPFRSYAIIANGAVILDKNGNPDEEWQDIMSKALAPYQNQLSDILQLGNGAAELSEIDVRSWIVKENDLSTYVVFKENDGDGSALKHILTTSGRDGWVRHHNGNNLAIIPPVVSKRIASEFLLKRLRSDGIVRPVIGFGDSVTDYSYLSLCDFWGSPKVSQISNVMNGV